MFEGDLAMRYEPLIEVVVCLLRTFVHSVGFSHTTGI
jgi:hypothetical protein